MATEICRYPAGEEAEVPFTLLGATEDELVMLAITGDINAYNMLGSQFRFNPNHGADGKFTSAAAFGGGAPATGTSPNIDATVADHLAQQVVTQGGFTYDVQHGVPEEYGYAVSPYPNRSEVIPENDFGGAHIETYVDRNADMLYRQDHMLGGWHDKEAHVVYLDTVVVLFEKDKAIAMGKVFNQKAIHDLQAGTDIATGGTGRSKRNLTPTTVEREVSKGGRACAECAANSDPANVPVHPGCMCSIDTTAVSTGVSPEEMAGLMEMHAASTWAQIGNMDFPESITLDPESAAVFSANGFRYGDLAYWMNNSYFGDWAAMLRDNESIGVFNAVEGVGLYLAVAYSMRDHDGAILMPPDIDSEGLAQAYSLITQEGG